MTARATSSVTVRSHLLLSSGSRELHRFVREEFNNGSLRELFERIVMVCSFEEKYVEYIQDLLREIPRKGKIEVIKGKDSNFYMTLGEDSYVPWELVLFIDYYSKGVYLAFDEVTSEEVCTVCDPHNRVYPEKGFLVCVEGCGRSFSSFVSGVVELDKVFFKNYGARLCRDDSMDEAVEEMRELLGECSIRVLRIQRL